MRAVPSEDVASFLKRGSNECEGSMVRPNRVSFGFGLAHHNGDDCHGIQIICRQNASMPIVCHLDLFRPVT